MHRTVPVLGIVLCLFVAGCGGDKKSEITDSPAPATWEESIGGDEFERADVIVPAAGGGYVIAGTISLGDATDVYIVKVDNDGAVSWERSIGGTGLDEPGSLVATPDGGYLLAGSTNSMGYGGLDAYLVKLDASGNKSWENAYGGAANDDGVFASAVADGYLLAGSTTPTDASGPSPVLVHINPSGTLRERDLRSGSEGVQLYAGAVTADGGAILVGTDARGEHSFPEVYLLRTNADGDVVWENSYGGDVVIHSSAIAPTSDGYVIAGHISADSLSDIDAYVAKLDGSGILLWQKTLYSDHPDAFQGVCIDGNGSIVLAGWTQAKLIRGSDVYLVKTTAGGTMVWERTFGGDSFDEAYGVTTTPEGGYLVVGRTASFGTGGGDFYVIKTDAQGKVEPGL